MYTPAQFEAASASAMFSLISAYPLATLVNQTSEGIGADHIPMLLAESGAQASLHGHVAKANPLWQQVGDNSAVLAIFQGPNRYISPNWYPSKREHGKVVPTWNYLVVHARGTIRWHRDPAWLRSHVEAATAFHEGLDNPWRVSDAPAEFIDRMLSAIVGFEIRILELTGKWKLNQNRTEADRQGVIAGLKSRNDSVAAEMAAQMERGQGTTAD